MVGTSELGFENRGLGFLGTIMADQRNNRWNWEVTGFEPRKASSSTSSPRSASVDFDDYKPGAPLVRRYSISAASVLPQQQQHSELSKHAMASKLQKLKDKVKVDWILALVSRISFWGFENFELSS